VDSGASYISLWRIAVSKRKMKNSGWVDYKKHPRGPNGRGLCRWCGKEVPKGKRTWCGPACIHEHRTRSSSSYQAKILYERDAGVCDICGINTVKVQAEYRERRSRIYKEIDDLFWDYRNFKAKGKVSRQLLDDLYNEYKQAGWNVYNIRWWDVDHKLPVSEGGGPDEWPRSKPYIDNLRTLCHPCHKKETAKLKKRLAKSKNKKKS
jgi:5-methylcytosine-specific restriction protein A